MLKDRITTHIDAMIEGMRHSSRTGYVVGTIDLIQLKNKIIEELEKEDHGENSEMYENGRRDLS